MSGTWWPAAGLRNYNSGTISGVGYGGWYWSSTRHSTAYCSYLLYFYYSGSVTPSDYDSRSNGLSVRCVQEEAQFRRPRPNPNPLLFYAARPQGAGEYPPLSS